MPITFTPTKQIVVVASLEPGDKFYLDGEVHIKCLDLREVYFSSGFVQAFNEHTKAIKAIPCTTSVNRYELVQPQPILAKDLKVGAFFAMKGAQYRKISSHWYGPAAVMNLQTCDTHAIPDMQVVQPLCGDFSFSTDQEGMIK